MELFYQLILSLKTSSYIARDLRRPPWGLTSPGWSASVETYKFSGKQDPQGCLTPLRGCLTPLSYQIYRHDCDKRCLKNLACGGLSLLLYLNFVYDSINYFYTTVTNLAKNISPAAIFRRSCISISLT